MKTAEQKAAEKAFPHNGIPIEEMTEEQLENERQRIVKEKMQIIGDLNKIKYPINATVFTHGSTWTIRNKSFWESMKRSDESVLEFMQNYLQERK